mgnify:CR=1 FL=1
MITTQALFEYLKEIKQKEGDIVKCKFGNGKNENNFAGILQFVGQWLVTTGDFVTIVGQAIALEQDKIEKLQEEKEKEEQEQQQQQMQEQIEQMQQQLEKIEPKS